MLKILLAQALRYSGSHPDPEPILQWFLDHGAKFSLNDIKEAVFHEVDEDPMAILIRATRWAATSHGAVATAVQHGNIEVVRLLLDARASPNGSGGGIYDIREPVLKTPLIEAIQGRLGNAGPQIRRRMAIARLLLERDANPSQAGAYGESALAMANRKGGSLWINLFDEFGAYTDRNPLNQRSGVEWQETSRICTRRQSVYVKLVMMI
jgi:hypothetical protein